MVKKIIIAYLLILFLGFLASGYFISTFLRDQMVNEIAERLQSNLILLRLSISDETENGLEGLNEFVQERAREIDARLTVIRGDGVVLAESGSDPETMDNHNSRPEVQAARHTGEGHNIRFSDTLNEEMLYVAVPLSTAQRDGIIIRLALPISKVQGTLNVLYRSVVTVLVVVSILVGLTGLIFFRQELRPLNEISRVAEAVSKGDWSQKAAVNAKSEIGELALAFNRMIEELSVRLNDLTQQKEKLETVITSMQEGVVALDAADRVKECNAAAVRYLNIEEPIPDAFFSDYVQKKKLYKSIDKVRKKGKPRSLQTIINSRNLDMGITPLSQEGEVLLVIRDVTESLKYEALRREFVGNVSHELRTPLSIAVGFIETLQDGALEEPQQSRKFINTIDRNLRQLTNLVDDLLVLSDLESRADEAVLVDLEIEPLIREVVEDLESLASRKEHVLQLPEKFEPGQVRADPVLLERALKNLIENAVKYTPAGGKISIEVGEDDNHMLLKVTDTGIGVPEEHMSRIFERFYRVDKSRSREMGGTGLGLSIVKHIAQLHQGTVSVTSKSGKGSTFTLKIPL